jgi:hypothetical protein
MAIANIDFKIGATLCWLSSVILPLGLLAIGGGPCAGPRNATGSAILLVVGAAAIIGPVYGVFRVVQFFRAVSIAAKVFGMVSLLYASAVAVIGSLFLFLGVLSLRAFML